jgi:hypothetical protein
MKKSKILSRINKLSSKYKFKKANNKYLILNKITLD